MDLELDQFKDVNLVIDKANDIFIPRQFVSQGDYKGRTLTVQITNNGSIGEVPGLTLNLNWHNEASGLTDLTAFTILDKANSIFRIEYPDNMMTPGKVYASIQIIQDGKVTNLKQFELIVQKLAGQPVGIVEKAEFSALVAVLADSNKFRTDIDSLSASKADKNYINDYLSKVTVVPETFTNLAAIQAKYPSGKNGLMVAADNGHKYIWTNRTWTDAGIYQSTGLADGSVTPAKVSTNVIPAFPYIIGTVNLDSTNKTITFPAGNVLIPFGAALNGVGFEAQTLTYTGTSWIVFDTTDKLFKINNMPATGQMLVGYVNGGSGWFYVNSASMTRDGYSVDQSGFIAPSRFPLLYSSPGNGDFVYDAKVNTLTFPKQFKMVIDKEVIEVNTVSNGGLIPDSLTITGTNFIRYNPQNKTIELGEPSYNRIVLGYVDVLRKKLILNSSGVQVINDKDIKITYLGDSITEGVHTSKRYLEYIGDKLTAKSYDVRTVNLGIGGTRITSTTDRPDGFVNRWQDIPTDSDVIVVFGGTNDYGGSSPMGEMTDDKTTFKGALNELITSIQNTYPNADLLVLTPVKRYYRSSTEPWSDEDTWKDGDKFANDQNLLLSDYVEAVKEVAGYNGAKVIDLYHNSGFNPRVEANYNRNTVDGLHPNAVGHYLLYKQIYPEVLNCAKNREQVTDPNFHN